MKTAVLGFCMILYAALRLGGEGYTADTIEVDAFVVEDAATGNAIIAKNSHARYPAASTIKLATALVAAEYLRDNDVVTIPEAAALAAPAKLFLKKGEQYRFRDLQSAMLVRSANDAALAVAIHVAGSEKAFVSLMNRWCLAHGLRETVVADVTGLSPATVSSAADIAALFKIFCARAGLVSLLAYKELQIRSLAGRVIPVKNSNSFHAIFPESHGKLTGKTGYTGQARYCFAGRVDGKGHRYIIAMLGARTAWHPVLVLMGTARRYYKE